VQHATASTSHVLRPTVALGRQYGNDKDFNATLRQGQVFNHVASTAHKSSPFRYSSQPMVLAYTPHRMTYSRAESVLAKLTLEEKVASASSTDLAMANTIFRSVYLLAPTSGRLFQFLTKVSLRSR